MAEELLGRVVGYPSMRRLRPLSHALPLLLLASAFATAFATAAFGGDGTSPAPAAGPVAPAAATDSARSLLARCTYAPCDFEMKVQASTAVGGAGLLVEKLEFASPVRSADPERNDVVKARLFRTATSEPAVVVFLSGWRMDLATPSLAARFAAETNLQALCVDLPFQGERTPRGRAPGELTLSGDLDRNEEVFAQASQDVARALDWLVRERKVDPQRIGLLGTSLGGYVAADLYGMSDRFRCCVVQIAGGDVASVIFNGNRLTAGIRDALLSKGLDEERVRARMRPLDPSSWARAERKDGLLLIAAERDEIVPLPSVKALAEAYGGARLVVMPGARHVDPANLVSHFPQAIQHLRERLVARAPAPSAR
jgi:dienelactone hydrolase